jgi:hypothetical protein
MPQEMSCISPEGDIIIGLLIEFSSEKQQAFSVGREQGYISVAADPQGKNHPHTMVFSDSNAPKTTPTIAHRTLLKRRGAD